MIPSRKNNGNLLVRNLMLKMVQQHSLKPNFPSTVLEQLGTQGVRVNLLCFAQSPLATHADIPRDILFLLFSEYLQNTFRVPSEHAEIY